MSQEQSEQANPIDLLTVGELISLAEAARLSGFTQDYLKKVAQRGRLSAKKIGRNWVTTAAAVEQYKASRSHILKDV